MTYDYQCDQCSAIMQIERSIHDKSDAPKCANCDQAMKRIWTSPAISFRGTGWGRG